MSAYQYSAFQLNAFQIDAPVLGDCEQDYVEAGYLEAGYVCGVEVKTAPAVGGGRGKRRSQRSFIERDGKILVFETPTDAAAYIAAEKAIESAKAVDKPRIIKRAQKAIKRSETIDIAQLLQAHQNERERRAINEAWAKKAYEDLIDFQIRLAMNARLAEDEEDIEVLLLS